MDNEFEDEIVDGVLGGAENDIEKIFEESPSTTRKRERLRKRNDIEKMFEESPSTTKKRERLKKSIQKLKESKEVVEKIIDKINEIPLIEAGDIAVTSRRHLSAPHPHAAGVFASRHHRLVVVHSSSHIVATSSSATGGSGRDLDRKGVDWIRRRCGQTISEGSAGFRSSRALWRR
ncbi:hypothetical protein KSP40_PGU019140 [Platanthera guangdongensis]|uniref:GED domain-containing protein n=1 Tax=Platanthera guangdongensis TaxID=2320717 RepID=A0ABR2N4B4_9ASPA